MSDLLQNNNLLKQAKRFIPDLTVTIQKCALHRSKYGLAQIYSFSIITKNGKYSAMFTDSIHNYKNNITINLDDILYSWIVDVDCFRYSEDFDDFCLQFGYNFKNYDIYDNKYILGKRQAEKAWKGCKYAYRKMFELLTDEQVDKLHDLFQDY